MSVVLHAVVEDAKHAMGFRVAIFNWS